MLFYRFSTFVLAQERRTGAVLGMACVDHFLTMEVVLGEFSARKFLVGASCLLGAVFGEHKTRWPSSLASCSGVHVHPKEVGSNRITVRVRLLMQPLFVAKGGMPQWSLLERRGMHWLLSDGGSVKLSSRSPHAWSCGCFHYSDHGYAVISSALDRGDPTWAKAHSACRDASWPDPAEAWDESRTTGVVVLELVVRNTDELSGWQMASASRRSCAQKRWHFSSRCTTAPLVLPTNKYCGLWTIWMGMSSLVLESARPEDVGHNASMHTTLAAPLSTQIWSEWVDRASFF